MTEWFVSSVVLAAALIALRYALRGKISPKLQYGLWALLLIRLLVPVSVGQSDVSVENLVPAAEHRVLYWRSAPHSRLCRRKLRNRPQRSRFPKNQRSRRRLVQPQARST